MTVESELNLVADIGKSKIIGNPVWIKLLN
jgi:hypothetical protein